MVPYIPDRSRETLAFSGEALLAKEGRHHHGQHVGPSFESNREIDPELRMGLELQCSLLQLTALHLGSLLGLQDIVQKEGIGDAFEDIFE